MADASDLAATLRHLPAVMPWLNEIMDQTGTADHEWMLAAELVAWVSDNAEALATALERGAAMENCYAESTVRFYRLMTVLMESIERGEDQSAQLELIVDAGDAYADWDDESRALSDRAKATAAKNAADRERGAAAEAVVEAWRSYEVLSNAGTAKAFAVLAAYDALTEEADDG